MSPKSWTKGLKFESIVKPKASNLSRTQKWVLSWTKGFNWVPSWTKGFNWVPSWTKGLKFESQVESNDSILSPSWTKGLKFESLVEPKASNLSWTKGLKFESWVELKDSIEFQVELKGWNLTP